jgi:NAD(P)-dependent dehydrogenase (short-subunit alcohol dehydrogenase family)
MAETKSQEESGMVSESAGESAGESVDKSLTAAKDRPIEGKVALVTGSTDGIGRQTALHLALRGATVIVHGRSADKAAETAKWIAREARVEEPKAIAADLAELANVHRLADEVVDAHGRLDVLVNNAGIYLTERRLTVDRLEAMFAVNHMAHFLLTNLLLPLLARSPAARVATVSSIAHQRAILDWNNLQAEKKFDPYGSYALSKLCNALFAFELARRAEGSRLASNALHPGVITTKLLMKGFGTTGASVETGARTPVFLASAPEVEGISGEYFVDCRLAEASRAARSRENQARLWELSAQFCGLA